MNGKKWYLSKTIWLNILSFVALIIQNQTGFVISPESQAAILVLLNLILRFETNQPIVN